MTLGDFRFPFKTSGPFPHRTEIARYVEAYAAHHKLQQYIMLRCEVVAVRIVDDTDDACDRWEIEYHYERQHRKRERFAAVFVASGQFTTPRMPRIVGGGDRNSSGIRIRHSSQFAGGDDLRGRSVVVVGIGNSALDVALEAVQGGAARVVVCFRRGTLMLPVATDDRVPRPRDEQLLSRFRNETLPSWANKLLFFWSLRAINAKFRAAGLPAPDAGNEGKSSPLHRRISNLKEAREWARLLASGAIALRASPLASVGPEARRVRFADGGAVDGVDDIVCCTGFQMHFPFLPKAVLDDVVCTYDVPNPSPATAARPIRKSTLVLGRRVMHPRFPTLCFFGFITNLGNEAAVGELQARWAVGTLAGLRGVRRPTRDALAAACAKKRAWLQRHKPLFPGFVQYIKYCDALATDLGCRPPRTDRVATWWPTALGGRWGPRLAWMLWRGPAVPAQYRLQGTGSSPLAREIVLQSKL